VITNDTRRIFKSKTVSSCEVLDLLQGFFVTELLDSRKRDLWLVSAWISDIPIIDNESSRFDGIGIHNPSKIKLVDVLVLLMRKEVAIKIVVREDVHNDAFLESLKHKTREKGLSEFLSIRKTKELHSKGIVSISQYYNGSMNITYNGIYKNDETVTMTINEDEISQALTHFRNEYGELLNEV